jgi:hypothetical protein
MLKHDRHILIVSQSHGETHSRSNWVPLVVDWSRGWNLLPFQSEVHRFTNLAIPASPAPIERRSAAQDASIIKSCYAQYCLNVTDTIQSLLFTVQNWLPRTLFHAVSEKKNNWMSLVKKKKKSMTTMCWFRNYCLVRWENFHVQMWHLFMLLSDARFSINKNVIATTQLFVCIFVAKCVCLFLSTQNIRTDWSVRTRL